VKRFLMLVGVAVVAAAMYVAASPASQQSKGPTAKQFNALKKQVAGLSKSVKTLKTEANDLATLLTVCYFTVSGSTAKANGLPVSQFGSSTNGFLFGTTSATATPRTALDVVTSGTPTTYLQEVNPTCVTGGALKHLLAKHAH
jgi:Cu/Zn superoxide dismutase